MPNIKFFEVRDRATFIPVMAIKMSYDATNIKEEFLISRGGFGRDNPSVILIRLSDSQASHDPYEWTGSRTMHVAHLEISDKFDQLQSGELIDVEFILGEKKEKKKSEYYDR